MPATLAALWVCGRAGEGRVKSTRRFFRSLPPLGEYPRGRSSWPAANTVF